MIMNRHINANGILGRRLSNNVLNRNLVGWWDLSEGRGDIVYDLALRKPGIITDQSTIPWVRSGAAGIQCLDFSGDNNTHRIDLGSIAAGDRINLNASNTDGCTFMALFRLVENSNNNFPRLFDKSNGGNAAEGWAAYPNVGSNRFDFQADGVTAVTFTTFTNSYFEGNWRLIVITHDGGSANKMYGSQILRNPRDKAVIAQTETETKTMNFPTTTTNAALGNWNHATDRNFQGQIALIATWDRFKSDHEVQHLMENWQDAYLPHNGIANTFGALAGTPIAPADAGNVQVIIL